MISPTYTDETVETDKFTLAFDALVREAEKAIALFREYRGHHAAKEPPDIGKAIRNNDAADDLEVALKAALSAIPRPSTGSDAGDLVKRLETEAEILRDWREPGHSVLRATAEEIDCAIAMIAALTEENDAGRREGLEMAAEWHDEAASAMRAVGTSRIVEAAYHVGSAAAIRALVKPGQMKAAASIAALSEENERLKAAPVSPTREDVARAIAIADLPVYLDDAIWAEDLEALKRRAERGVLFNCFRLADAVLNLFHQEKE